MLWRLPNYSLLVCELFKIYDRVDVNYKNIWGLTHFHVACECGCYDVAEKFLELGHDPNLREEEAGYSPIHLAIMERQTEVIKLLLKNGADPNLRTYKGSTPLHVICRKDKINDGLLEQFFKINDELHLALQVNAGDKWGNTPLHTAMDTGSKKSIELLLRNDADPNVPNKMGLTPLHRFCTKPNPDLNRCEIIQKFFDISDELNRPVQIDAKDENDRSPLQWAICCRCSSPPADVWQLLTRMHERIPLTLGRCHQRTTMFRSNCPSGGLFVVEGELGLLMTAMRRGVRWSSHSHQDEDQDILMKNLAGLKETLNDAKDLSQLEPSAFMAPFLEIIRSEETTGPVTSLALSAVNKIISYGLIDPEHPAIVPCVEAIADTVTHARFVGTDASGDGVVLMRILQVLRALVLSQPGDNLSNESICEIMLSCFRICLETRLSELLRRTAEHCLRDMVYHLFVRLSQFADDTRGLLSMRKMRTNSMETTKSKPKKNKISAKPKSKLNLDDMDDAEAQLLSPVEKVEKVKVNHLATTPISPAGNIVDMQGSLNHGTSDKSDDGKGDSKTSAVKNINGKENSESNTAITDPEKKISKNENSENGQEIESLNNDNKLSEEQMDNKVGQVSNLENNQGNAENKCNDIQSPSGSIEDLSVDDGMNINNTKLPNNKPDGESVEEYVNSQGIRFTTVQQHTPYGSLCIRELFRFLVSLCSPHDKQNTEVMIHLGLSLLQVVLEVAADSLANFPSLLALAKDELARNLIVLLAIGAEKFNESPREGIAKLTEYGLLGGTPGHPDPNEIAKFLRENPTLDKKQIGEYISKKENGNVLQAFVNSFNWSNTRLDVAVRQYLETFRLPGEAPLIFLLLEKFAEHWHESNNHPFASTDAAFTLAYAIIMLNVDQHNNNVKRQNNPMTAEDFKKNLKSTNGDADFDQEMLDEIYTAIKTDEIVMPAEQTGLVKENYLWKCLLRRGANPESLYIRVGDASDFIDKELAEKAWAPIISALCRAYDKAPDRNFQRKVATAFFSCAAISAHYGMTSDLDTLIVSLCKFTGLAAVGQPDQIVLKLGGSGSCQLATRTLFKITHLHGDALRASWKNIVDCLQILYKAKLLPKSLTHGADFLDPSGKVSLIVESAPKPAPVEQGILSSLYSYIASDTSRTPHPAEAVAKKRANDCIAHCYLKEIIEESKLLQLDSLQSLVTALMSANPADEGTSVFLLEQLIELTIENCDRASMIYPMIQPHLESLVTASARENQPHLLERTTVGMLRLGTKLLLAEDFARILLQPLAPLTHLPSASVSPLARQISYGLFELLKIGAANIHSTEDWKVVFNLLECAGAGALQPKQSSNNPQDENSSSRSTAAPLDPRPVSPVPEWVLVSPTGTGTEAPLPVAADIIVLDRKLQAHDPLALIKCCESLSFLVRDVAHVTPFNFELCVRCVRTFAEAVLNSAGKRGRVHLPAGEELPQTYQQTPIQLLDLMHTLHTKTAQVFRWWAEEGNEEQKKQISTSSLWSQAWRPLLQGIARLCCDSRRPVRAAAITSLQSSTLLAHDFSQLSAVEWSQCLEQVLFPLLAQLLGPVAPSDPLGLEETRVRAAMLLSKVFLHHLNPLLTLPGFLPLWLTVLDLLRSYMHADNSENLYEAIPESLKNMLLVMASAGVLQPESYLWTPTWRAIDAFLPNLKGELFPEPPPQPAPKPAVAQSPPQSPTPTQQTPVAAAPAGAAAQAQAEAQPQPQTQTQNHSFPLQSYSIPIITPYEISPPAAQFQISSPIPIQNQISSPVSSPTQSPPLIQGQNQIPTSSIPSHTQLPVSSVQSQSQLTSTMPAMASSYFV
ncbi:unnamed protein product [Trichogramma brassicae]|uniref:SEC7 domain-containing protein n=1 Tax=Trichogramma brassicae TaxID=86971 RepID=A0A6H5J277_9HYME|nr:unnamed protein product [Trichogramma brassicae]